MFGYSCCNGCCIKTNDFIQPKTSDHTEGSDGGYFKSLADEFTVLEKTSPAIDANLAEIV